jgi:hypothetical protein
MVVDGVGSYAADVTEDYPAADRTTPLARESESYYKFKGSKIEALKRFGSSRAAVFSVTSSTTWPASARSTAARRAIFSATGTSAAS